MKGSVEFQQLCLCLLDELLAIKEQTRNADSQKAASHFLLHTSRNVAFNAPVAFSIQSNCCYSLPESTLCCWAQEKRLCNQMANRQVSTRNDVIPVWLVGKIMSTPTSSPIKNTQDVYTATTPTQNSISL